MRWGGAGTTSGTVCGCGAGGGGGATFLRKGDQQELSNSANPSVTVTGPFARSGLGVRQCMGLFRGLAWQANLKPFVGGKVPDLVAREMRLLESRTGK